MKREKDYYQILGVSPQATSAEIRRVYHQLAIQNHPDRNPSPQATLRMQEINEAYSVLGEKRKRIKYDSERGYFSTEAQTNSAPQKTATFARDVLWRIEFRPLGIASSVFMISTYILFTSLPLPWWSMLSNWGWWMRVFWENRELPFFAFFAVLLSLVSMGGIFVRMWLKFREINSQRPKCGKA
jgi:preprotein translocase subunit Sec63